MAPAKKTVKAGRKASKPKPTAYGSYFTANDGIYRSFLRACSAGLVKGVAYGPTFGQLAGALMGIKDKNENNLPDCWRKFADRHKDHAHLLRRSVAEVRVSNGSKFQLDLPEGTVKMKKWLEIRNPDYETGMPAAAGSGTPVKRVAKAATAKSHGGKNPKIDDDDDDEDATDENFSDLDEDDNCGEEDDSGKKEAAMRLKEWREKGKMAATLQEPNHDNLESDHTPLTWGLLYGDRGNATSEFASDNANSWSYPFANSFANELQDSTAVAEQSDGIPGSTGELQNSTLDAEQSYGSTEPYPSIPVDPLLK